MDSSFCLRLDRRLECVLNGVRVCRFPLSFALAFGFGLGLGLSFGFGFGFGLRLTLSLSTRGVHLGDRRLFALSYAPRRHRTGSYRLLSIFRLRLSLNFHLLGA